MFDLETVFFITTAMALCCILVRDWSYERRIRKMFREILDDLKTIKD